MSGTIVRDIMSAVDGYGAVHDGADLGEAIRVLQRSFYRDDKGVVCGHPSVLVTDQDGELTGILTIQDILKALERKSAERSLPTGGLFSRLSLLHDTLAQVLVRDAMTPVAKAGVEENERAGRVIRRLVESADALLPVTSEGKTVGIVRAIDLVERIVRLLAEKQEVILSFLTVS